MLDDSACARHGEGNFQGGDAAQGAGFGNSLSLLGILRPDDGYQTGGGNSFQRVRLT